MRHYKERYAGQEKGKRVTVLQLLLLAVVSAMVTIAWSGDARAVPSFSRKYGTSCQTCHTHYPMLTPFGEAFRRNGYRFPSNQGSTDADVAKEETLPLGQPEDRSAFPRTVWPGHISQTVPLGGLVNMNLPWALPESDLKKTNGNSLTWANAVGPFLLYAAGSISDNVTYYAKVSLFAEGYVGLGPAYVLFNDLVGPRHLVNLWVGRLLAPQLTSHQASGSYVADRAFPLISVAGLFNSNHSNVIGQGPSNGVELNGIAWHRFSYAAGWLASSAQTGLNNPNAQDFYARVGGKLGGMSLDGEGGPSSTAVNVARPWAETAVTFDIFGYRGLTVADNLTNAPAVTAQRNRFYVLGAAARLQLGSFGTNAILQRHYHDSPYAGTDPRPASPPDQPLDLPGVPDRTSGRATVATLESSYVVFPWLVPALRLDHTYVSSDWGSGYLTRFTPGVSLLLRSNMRLYVYADMQRAVRSPAQPPRIQGSWGAASSSVEPPSPIGRRSSVEAIVARMSWAF